MPVIELARHDGGLPMWVVYDHPTDFPNGFAARRWVGETATPEVVAAPTLEAVREAVVERFPGGFRLARFANDDPKIVEVWL